MLGKHDFEKDDNTSSVKYRKIEFSDTISNLSSYIANDTANQNEMPKNEISSSVTPTLSVENEIKRKYLLKDLRKHYTKLCNEKLNWKNEPKSSFNRFLTDHLLLKSNNSKEPLLPNSIDIKEDKYKWAKETRIYQEIIEDLPLKIKPPIQFVKGYYNLKNHFKNYLNGCNDVIRLFKESEKVKELEIYVNNGFEYLSNNYEFKQLNDIYKEIRDKIHPILIELYSPIVVDIIMDLLSFSDNLTKQFSHSNDCEEIITKNDDNDEVCLTYNNEIIRITKITFKDLMYFYKQKQNTITQEDNKKQSNECENNILKSIFILCCRYNSFIGDSYGAGGLQAAIPRKLGYTLKNLFNVSMECFASPLNAYFPSYCSAFYDTDNQFGSVGSFFNFKPKCGSFEANPPFCELLMDKMVEHIESILKSSNEALSFIIIIPDWEDSSAYQNMLKSSFFRKKIKIKGKQHYYKSGLQYKKSYNKSPLYYKAVHDTSIFFLQNEMGFEKYKPIQQKLKQVEDAFYSNNDSY